jgi:hypothetical protein
MEGVREDFAHGPMLKAMNDKSENFGSVRAHPEPDGTVMISKFVVKPEYERQGIGTRLLRAIDALFPSDNLSQSIRYTFRDIIPFYEKEGWVRDVKGMGSDTVQGWWFLKNQKSRRQNYGRCRLLAYVTLIFGLQHDFAGLYYTRRANSEYQYWTVLAEIKQICSQLPKHVYRFHLMAT